MYSLNTAPLTSSVTKYRTHLSTLIITNCSIQLKIYCTQILVQKAVYTTVLFHIAIINKLITNQYYTQN